MRISKMMELTTKFIIEHPNVSLVKQVPPENYIQTTCNDVRYFNRASLNLSVLKMQRENYDKSRNKK